jgi:predicted AAA+ superfamily ATPase
MKLQRAIQPLIERWLFRNKIIILYGPRQVGKTTLARTLLEKHGYPGSYFNCEIPSQRARFESKEPSVLKRTIGDSKIIVLDEAQKVPDIGLILKILIDTFPDLQIIATGSSSFELADRTSEPLTGRALTFTLFPFSYNELSQAYSGTDLAVQLDFWLRFGTYPEIALAPEADARILIDDITDRYLYKDVLAFENIRNADMIKKLLQLLAFQLGNEVSFQEVGNQLNLHHQTVMRYIDLLEKAFVIFRLGPFSRNLRKEITKKQKIYFYDIGVRNSIIQQLQPLDIRNDKGHLWENFLIVERYKALQIKGFHPNRYFWRTYDQQEVDYIEEIDGRLTGYEFKWQTKKKKVPPAFVKSYPNATLEWIDRHNFESFILMP